MTIYAYPVRKTADDLTQANAAVYADCTTLISGHPHPSAYADFLCPNYGQAHFKGGSREPNTTPSGNKFRRLITAVEARHPTKGATTKLNDQESVMTNHTQVASATLSILDTNIRCIDGLYSLNDLHKAAGGEAKHQPNRFLRNEQTQALIAEINNENKRYPNLGSAIRTINGNNGGTYACKEIVVAYGAWIDVVVHLAVIRAFLDTQPTALPQATPDILPPSGSRDFLRETVLDGKTWYRLSDIAYRYFTSDASTLGASIRRKLGDNHCRNLRIHSPRYGWQHCLYATREGIEHCIKASGAHPRTRPLAAYLKNAPAPRATEGCEYTPAGSITGGHDGDIRPPTANTSAMPVPDCRMMLVLKDGKAVASQVLPDDAFACNVDGLINIIDSEYFSNRDLINVSRCIQNKLAQRLSAVQGAQQ